MNRRDELIQIFSNVSEDQKTILINLIDEVVFLEEQLSELRKLPMLKHHPSHPEIVKPTASFKAYKEMLQQYNNTIKNLSSFLKKSDSDEESPLRVYLRGLDKHDKKK